ncbi:MAG: metallophosphoesterase [Succinivibrionaceae bacterium]|nr:metallophosphoesterase [Succinivibrionaceae bacterium]
MLRTILAALLCCLAMRCMAYELVWLGDMHYDSRVLHSEDYLAEEEHQRALERNLYSWDGPAQRLLAAAGKAARGTGFAFQVGDFSQGHGGTRGQSLLMFSGAIDAISSHLGVPTLFTPGNHEYRGKGARSALRTTLLPHLSRALGAGVPLKGYNFSISHEGDAFIFWNSVDPDLAWLQGALADHRGARHTFIVTHFPILPMAPVRIGWIPFGAPGQEMERQSLLGLLCHRNAIVLCGHIHEQAVLDYSDGRGRVTQVSSLALVRPHREGPSEGQARAIPYASLGSVRAALGKGGFLGALIDEYLPHVTAYERIGGAGYSVLRVNGEQIFNDFYGPGEGMSPVSRQLR